MTNNYYKDLYENYKKSEFKDKLAHLEIADEMNCAFTIGTIKDKDFETLCGFTYEMWLDYEHLSIHDIVWAIYGHFERNDLHLYDIEDLKTYLDDNYYEIKEDACYYGC